MSEQNNEGKGPRDKDERGLANGEVRSSVTCTALCLINWKDSSEEGETQVRTPSFPLGQGGGGRMKLTLERYMHVIYV